MKIKIIVTLKNGVLDPQGKAIQQTLNGMGFNDVKEVRQGKYFDIEINEIDDLEQGIASNWWEPQSSGSTTGIIPDSTWMEPNPQVMSLLYESSRSMEIAYGWDLSDSQWLIRVYLSGGPAREVSFNDSKTMQAYVFGDGSGNKFRFCVDDNLSSTSSSNHEVSPWYIIDWVGWRLISWDMDVDVPRDQSPTNPIDNIPRTDLMI